MPISKYDQFYGGTGGAQKAYDAMQSQYGAQKGKQVFYALKNKRAGKHRSRRRHLVRQFLHQQRGR